MHDCNAGESFGTFQLNTYIITCDQNMKLALRSWSESFENLRICFGKNNFLILVVSYTYRNLSRTNR